ncbi:HAD ATPase, P-type, family IC [Edhazardia aedis USNM 41457]|uniref:HAD ATPase, P-type, family IC n=1 Tax=Edhazardia aedis (strain USNM 41457) TaxID=1003232 RepID=J9D065_EDHAE|nr:HAD ATPase, P-type, family IC [Edhazardia aedis USNM 41457]|eukprot:EJW01261.1 HAD ATPase, P-type, family IC [Edhazardia aedis USNM 41457]
MSNCEHIKDIINGYGIYRSLIVAYKELNPFNTNIIYDNHINETDNSNLQKSSKDEKLDLHSKNKITDEIPENQKSIDFLIQEYSKIDLDNRAKKIDNLFKKIENDLIYLGSTFVEDKIQKGVKECINSLLEAGIKIWMVTGDKRETAESCGALCGLVSEKIATPQENINNRLEQTALYNEDYLDLNQVCYNEENTNLQSSDINNPDTHNKQYISETDSNLLHNNNRNHLLDDSETDNPILTTKNPKFNSYSAEEALANLEKGNFDHKTAIIYRASPEQKAKIAKYLNNVAAIGDGNNDIMMLQESSVGIGIRGKEGTQASMSADFSVASFTSLKRLFLVHGHNNYIRMSKVALSSIYKNLLLISIQFFYNFFNGYSGRPVFNYFFLNYFNVLFTSLLPFYTILFDKDKEDKELLENPILYKNSTRFLKFKIIVLNLILAVFKGALIFWLSYFIFDKSDFTDRNGKIGGYSAMNNWFSILVFLTVLMRQVRLINFFNIFSYVCIIFTILFYFFSIFVIQEFTVETRNSAFHLYSMPVSYFGFLCVMGIVLFVDYIYDVTQHLI